MAISCDPNALAALATCMQCENPKTHLEIQTYILAVIAGLTTDADALALLAKDFQRLSPATLQQIMVYELCQIATALGV